MMFYHAAAANFGDRTRSPGAACDHVDEGPGRGCRCRLIPWIAQDYQGKPSQNGSVESAYTSLINASSLEKRQQTAPETSGQTCGA